MTQRTIVAVVTALIEATKRIPAEYGGITFFSAHDTWRFILHRTEGTCIACDELEGSSWHGDQLRTPFRYLTILGVNTIGGPIGGDGLVHPNCRCRLDRVSAVEEPSPEKLDKEPFYWVDSGGQTISKEDKERYIARVKQVMKELPKEHLEGLDEVTIVTEFPGSPNTAARYRRDAMYVIVDGHPQQSEDWHEQILVKIASLESEPMWDEQLHLYHEVGHHVWFDKLSGQTQSEWYQFYRDKQDTMPTQYGKGLPGMAWDASAQEGFAECYSYLKFNPHSTTREIRRFFTKNWFDPEIKESP